MNTFTHKTPVTEAIRTLRAETGLRRFTDLAGYLNQYLPSSPLRYYARYSRDILYRMSKTGQVNPHLASTLAHCAPEGSPAARFAHALLDA